MGKKKNHCNSGPDPGLFLALHSPDVPCRAYQATHNRARAHTPNEKQTPNRRAHTSVRAQALAGPCLLIKARRCLSPLLRRAQAKPQWNRIPSNYNVWEPLPSKRTRLSAPLFLCRSRCHTTAELIYCQRCKKRSPTSAPNHLQRGVVHVLLCDGGNQNISSRAYFLPQWKTSK